MCGIAGFIGNVEENSGDICSHMVAALSHRGPDDTGIWVEQAAGLALGHRRLSIQDLSSFGHQPMVSLSGRFVVTYNGEIYNFHNLRNELQAQGCAFRGHSDTEVLLAAVEAWGVEKALGRFVGMFSFALWDKDDRTLYLARDRLGEKPLYYGWQGRSFLFASELKALRQHPAWQGEVDRDALALYMRHNYVPAPWSIYRGIRKLLPGTLLRIPTGLRPAELPDPEPYWSAAKAVEAGLRHPFEGTDEEAVEALDRLLRTTLGDKMISDVPLGAFLSGGYDSSLIVALMQELSDRPVKTFSIGFHEETYNEAQHAAAVARHLQTDHTELYVTPEEAMAVIPELPRLYDEPFADSSQIPTFLVSRLARKQVTVTLSGDGGDELFGGYNRYAQGLQILSWLHRLPRSTRLLLAGTLRALPPGAWDRLFTLASPLMPASMRIRLAGDKLQKLAKILGLEGEKALYRGLVSHWDAPEEVVPGSREHPTVLTDSRRQARLEDFTDYMMYTDLVSYLPDDILVKVDRASMGVSLEARVPLLDHRIVEFAWRLPRRLKVRDGQGKWILRQVLYRYVPREIMERPKMGFGVPIEHWLRGPLREWANTLLDERRLREEGWFNPAPIQRKWREHLSGRRNWAYHLWDVLMFQSWLEVARG